MNEWMNEWIMNWRVYRVYLFNTLRLWYDAWLEIHQSHRCYERPNKRRLHPPVPFVWLFSFCTVESSAEGALAVSFLVSLEEDAEALDSCFFLVSILVCEEPEVVEVWDLGEARSSFMGSKWTRLDWASTVAYADTEVAAGDKGEAAAGADDGADVKNDRNMVCGAFCLAHSPSAFNWFQALKYIFVCELSQSQKNKERQVERY